jgi:hypothetical protein
MKALEYDSRLVINGGQIGYEEILRHFLLSIPKQQRYYEMDREKPLCN